MRSSNDYRFSHPLLAKPVPADSPNAQRKSKPLPPVVAVTPLAFGTQQSASEPLIEYRSADQMNEADRDLAARAEPSIREGVRLAGIDFDKGKWTYRQLVCKALPGHVFLLFNSDSGRHDASSFSAAVPRSSTRPVSTSFPSSGVVIRCIRLFRSTRLRFPPSTTFALTSLKVMPRIG